MGLLCFFCFIARTSLWLHCLLDHLSFNMHFLLHRIFMMIILCKFMLLEIKCRLVLILFEPAIVILRVIFNSLLIFRIYILILCKYLAGLFGGRISFEKDFWFIKSLKHDLTEGKWLNDCTELWEIKFLILDSQSFSGQINQDFA